MSARSFGDAEASASIVKTVPAGRWGKPSDFKGVAVFLASAASDYVTLRVRESTLMGEHTACKILRPFKRIEDCSRGL